MSRCHNIDAQITDINIGRIKNKLPILVKKPRICLRCGKRFKSYDRRICNLHDEEKKNYPILSGREVL